MKSRESIVWEIKLNSWEAFKSLNFNLIYSSIVNTQHRTKLTFVLKVLSFILFYSFQVVCESFRSKMIMGVASVEKMVGSRWESIIISLHNIGQVHVDSQKLVEFGHSADMKIWLTCI